MADREWEARMDRMDARIASLLDVSENLAAVAKDHDGTIMRHEEFLKLQQEAVRLHQEEMAEFRSGLLELRAALDSLTATVDRFIQGGGGNGQR